jgi:hypothetical protein
MKIPLLINNGISSGQRFHAAGAFAMGHKKTA